MNRIEKSEILYRKISVDLMLSSANLLYRYRKFTNVRVANGRTWQNKIKTRCKSVTIFRIIPLHCMNNLDFKLLFSA